MESNPKCWVSKKILELGENWVKLSKIYVNYEGQIFGAVDIVPANIPQTNLKVVEEQMVYTNAANELSENPFEGVFEEDDLPLTSVKKEPYGDSDEVSTDEEVSFVFLKTAKYIT